MSRLTNASGSYGVTNYEYDAVGNRKSREQNNRLEAYTYAENSNRLLSVITENEQGELHTRTLAVGNIVNDSANAAAKELTFGHNNRLEQVKVNGNATTLAGYEYNAKGQRVIKQVGGKVIHFHYDTDNRLLAETTETGAPIREYIYAANQRIAMVDYQRNATGDIYFIINDHLGTPQRLLDAQQHVVWSVDQSPFGEVTIEGNIEQPLRFPGQYADAETGYSYNYFRDYDPTLGRYIESDPIGLEAGVNTFGYVMGNPVALMDSWGLSKEDVLKINQQMTDYINASIERGERLDGSGYANGWYGNFIGKDGCITQACGLAYSLNSMAGVKGTFTDKWTFEVRQKGFFEDGRFGPHKWVVGISKNPEDPFLKIDPWANEFKEFETDTGHEKYSCSISKN